LPLPPLSDMAPRSYLQRFHFSFYDSLAVCIHALYIFLSEEQTETSCKYGI
jgi:hypothetical protein